MSWVWTTSPSTAGASIRFRPRACRTTQWPSLCSKRNSAEPWYVGFSIVAWYSSATIGRSSGWTYSKAFSPVSSSGSYPMTPRTDGVMYSMVPSGATTAMASVDSVTSASYRRSSRSWAARSTAW